MAERRIGAYRTLDIVGRGGMGTVFVAERVDGQFDHHVAIKLVRADAVSEARLQRFAAERQILARLNHPNIAKLLDGGIADDGSPYLVMELVNGKTLLKYCDDGRLGLTARLKLFRDVAAAVSYAHQNLVVHRDLKPSNIVVAADGRVKLLDFGIAKILDPGDESSVSPTVTGSMAMTPEYAAPEQFTGQPITTSTDVYGLGTVLYELLTGSRPLELAGLSPAAAETRAATEEPLLASRVVASEKAEPVAKARATTPGRLRRRLSGDLELICAMALRKEPSRRYRSVEQLSDDVRRHLEGLPVTAQRDRVRYRLKKFVERHPAGVAVGVAVFGLVAGLGAVSAVQSVKLERERDKAREVTELLVQAFEVYDPSESRGMPVLADDALERGVTLVDTELSGQPAVQADLLDALGRIHTNLGNYDKAAPLLERALDLRRGSSETTVLSMAESLDHLASLHQAKGEYERAAELFELSIDELERRDGPDSPAIARALNHLGGVLVKKGDYDEAEAALLDALERNESELGRRHVDTAESLNNLGLLHYTRGDYEAAEQFIREATEIRRGALGSDHPLVADSLSNLANTLSRAGSYDSAEEAQQEALAIRHRYLGPDHPHVATSLNNLALILFSKGDYEGAEPLLRQAVAIRKEKLRPDHPDAAQSLSNLGLLLQTTGRAGAAESMYREALAVRRKAFGSDHRLIGQSLNNLGMLLQTRGDLEGAEATLREADGMFVRLFGQRHPAVATSHTNLASTLFDLGRMEEAGALLEESLDIRRESLPEGHMHISYSLLGLGRVFRENGLHEQSRAYLEEALEIRVSHLGADHPLAVEVQEQLAR